MKNAKKLKYNLIRVARNEFFKFSRAKYGVLFNLQALRRLELTRQLHWFSVEKKDSAFSLKDRSARWGFSSRALENFPDSFAAPFKKTSRGGLMTGGDFFYKVVNLQFLVGKARYFYSSTLIFSFYVALKLVICLVVCCGAIGLFFFACLGFSPYIWLALNWCEAGGSSIFTIMELTRVGQMLAANYGFNALMEISDPLGFKFNFPVWTFFFQDFESFVSFTNFSSKLVADCWLLFCNLYVVATINIVGILFLLFSLVGLRILINRNDLWVYFFNLTYYAGWSFRFASLEPLYQMLGGVTGGVAVLDKELLRGVLLGGSNLQNKNYSKHSTEVILYYFSQTVGGYTGFLDLFPSAESYVNINFMSAQTLKTNRRFKLIKGYLLEKFNVHLVSSGEFGELNEVTDRRLNFKLSLHARRFSYYLGDQFPAMKSWGLLFRFSDIWRVISSAGDHASIFIRTKWFNSTTTRNYGYWFVSFLEDMQDNSNKKAYLPSRPSNFLWYKREVGAYSVRRRLAANFRRSAFWKFKAGYQSGINDFSFWRTGFDPEGKTEYFSFWDGFADDNSYASSIFRRPRFDTFEPTPETSNYFGGGSLSDGEDSTHPDYVDSYVETYFEDNFLHKDLPLTFFDDQLEEKLRDSRPNPDEDGLSYYKAEFLEDSSESEDLVYGAGQESDLLSRASSSDYSNLYTIEYGDVFSYKENGITSLYEDLADYWGLHASSLVTRVAGIPFGRTLFFGASNSSKVRHNWILRKRFGKLLFFYWNTFHRAMITNYWRMWGVEIFYLVVCLGICIGFIMSVSATFDWGCLFYLWFAAVTLALLKTAQGFDFPLLDWLLVVGRWVCRTKPRIVNVFLFKNRKFSSRVSYRLYKIALHVTLEGSMKYGLCQPPLLFSKLLEKNVAPYSAFRANCDKRRFLDIVALVPPLLIGKIFMHLKFRRFLYYRGARFIDYELIGSSYAIFSKILLLETQPGVLGNFYSMKYPWPEIWSFKTFELSLFGDLVPSTVGGLRDFKSLQSVGLLQNCLFEVRERLHLRVGSFTSNEFDLRALSVFLQYYKNRSLTRGFYPTLSYAACSWSLFWANTFFFNMIWPRSEVLGLRQSVESPTKSSSLDLTGNHRSGISRNKAKFFDFFQHQAMYENSTFAIADFSNFLRSFTFKRLLLQFFVASYGRPVGARISGFSYRTRARYTPYTVPLSRSVNL